jgi:hypothetical protein
MMLIKSGFIVRKLDEYIVDHFDKIISGGATNCLKQIVQMTTAVRCKRQKALRRQLTQQTVDRNNVITVKKNGKFVKKVIDLEEQE